ncbi:IS66-like element accessory protein TnpA [Novosphingobium colocasiae]|nr:transposase [Novosphingobium colocasiae]
MSCDDAGTSGVQRFEIFTGAGRRRDWPAEVKASIVAESFAGRETVCSVARRHGLSPSQLFTWRRELRKQLEGRGVTLPVAPTFVPAVIDTAPVGEALPPAKRPKKQRRSKASAVELEIDGVAVKIGRDADAVVIAAVIEALRATVSVRLPACCGIQARR